MFGDEMMNRIKGTINRADSPFYQLMTDLQHMNSSSIKLSDGRIPMAIWLQFAIFFSAGIHKQTFELALQQLKDSIQQVSSMPTSNRPEDWLAHAYPTNDSIERVCSRAGIHAADIAWKSTASHTWPEVLRLAGNMLRLPQLWDVVTTDPTKAAYHQKFREFQHTARNSGRSTGNPESIDRDKLINALCKIELKRLCFFNQPLEGAINHLSNSTPIQRANELYEYCERRGVLKELWNAAKKEAPGYF